MSTASRREVELLAQRIESIGFSKKKIARDFSFIFSVASTSASVQALFHLPKERIGRSSLFTKIQLEGFK